MHDDEASAFQAQVDALGAGTTLLVDTYDVPQAIRTAIEVAGPELGAVRLDSGDLAQTAAETRQLLDELGARNTRILVTSDLDEYAIANLRTAPIDGYGIGTRLVTGSGAPTAGLVYKLVERDGVHTAKTCVGKSYRGGRKSAVRRHDSDGTMTADVVTAGPVTMEPGDRQLVIDLVRGGVPCVTTTPKDALLSARSHHERVIAALPSASCLDSAGHLGCDAAR